MKPDEMDTMIKMPALVACLLLVALAAVACDRRDLQPAQESEATDSVILAPAATGPAKGDPLPPPATSCAGMSGQAEADCRAREQRPEDEVPRSGETRAADDETRR